MGNKRPRTEIHFSQTSTSSKIKHVHLLPHLLKVDKKKITEEKQLETKHMIHRRQTTGLIKYM